MDMKYSIISTFLLLLVAYVRAQDGTFDIAKYGAQPNADVTQALTDAWKAACEATAPSTLMIPPETYMLGQITLSGPCKAAVTIQLQGTLKAPEDPATFKADQEWVTLQSIDLLTLTGGGTLNGQGATAWGQNDCHKTGQCSKLPINLSLNSITNSLIQGVTSADSKLFHVNVLGCKNLTFVNFTISAPETSKNTDGIHIGRSNGINITDSNIKTGDDCVSIGDGSQQISVTKVTCGPGHGISVGSLGRYPNEQDVVGITVKNCTFISTMNGVRVKTWPASPPGIASDLHFEDLVMDNVGNPVLIDQEYCPYNQCTQNVPSKVKISKVSFKNIKGTSSTQLAVKLVCSKGFPCEGVEVGDIDLTYNGKEGPAISQCANLSPTFTGKLNPPECTAQAPGQAPAA
ncbi:hypothetical protein LguiB_004266 [Lonicera macranthoides]